MHRNWRCKICRRQPFYFRCACACACVVSCYYLLHCSMRFVMMESVSVDSLFIWVLKVYLGWLLLVVVVLWVPNTV